MKDEELIHAVNHVATAITPRAMPGHDAAGGTVDSLTEAIMGITAGLIAISHAIDSLATALETRNG